MLSNLWKQLIRSGGVFIRTIRAFFARQMTGITSRVRRVTNFSRNATKMATATVQSAISAAQKPTRREDYVETRRLLISKALLLKIILGIIAAALVLYFVVWPLVLSFFLTAHFVVGDSRIPDWTGRVIVYADKGKTLPVYAGRLKDGVLQGLGEEYDENGLLSYEGWFQDGQRTGNGISYEDGVMVYEGQFSNGVYEGSGTTYEDGMKTYEGQFSNGVYEGSGTAYKGGKKIYEGQFSNGIYEGSGTIYEDGMKIYDGQFSNGLYEGRGRLYEDGVLRYEGSFQGGEAAGDGTSYSASGELAYKGQFSGGLPEGTGTAYDGADQVLYRGGFAAGVYSGSGTLYLAEGGTLKATFADGEPEGVVQWERDGRLYYEGEWSGAQASGFGALYSRSGAALYEGQFLGGTLDGNWLLGLTAEELRAVLGEDNIRDVSTNDGFLIVSDALGLAALCSFQTEEAEPEVYTVYIFQPEEERVCLLPGMNRVSLPAWPEDTEDWSGQLNFAPPAGVALDAGTYAGQVFTTEESRITILYGAEEEEESASVLLSWSRLEGTPAPGGHL